MSRRQAITDDGITHYRGTREGKLVVRGIEIRRHDTPNLVKQFQTELLSILFDCKSKEEVIKKGYERAHLLVMEAIDRIMIGGDDITVSLVSYRFFLHLDI